MPADGWRLVRLRTTGGRATVVPPAGATAAAKRLVRRALRPVADRTRGRIGVHSLRLGTRVLVVAESWDALRAGLDQAGLDQAGSDQAGSDQAGPDHRESGRPTRRAALMLLWWRGPWRGWSGRPGPLTGLVAARVRTPRLGRGPARVRIEVDQARPAGDLLAAGAAALRPNGYAPARSAQVHCGESGLLLVDATRINPRGRRFEADQPGAPRYALRLGVPRGPALSPWRRGRDTEVGWPTLAALRGVGVVECADLPGADPYHEAGLLVQLAMAGVVVHAPRPAPAVQKLLDPRLAAILAEPVPTPRAQARAARSIPASTVDDPAEVLALEERSVRQRREALRRHSQRFGAAVARLPTVSVLLATRRPAHLATILPAVIGQTYPNLEIVVCLHGVELPESAARLLADAGRPYQVMVVDAGVVFGSVLGAASARAGGDLLSKVDDDDTYGPEHVWDLVLAHHYAGATLVGKGAEFVYLEDSRLTIRRYSGAPESEDSFVAGGTMLIAKSDLAALGGWRPVPRAVDRGLLDRVNRAGAAIYRTHPLGYLYHRRAEGHTWDPGRDVFLQRTRQRFDGLLRSPEFGTASE